MTITLWSGLEDLNFLVGADFPEADEDALWRCAGAWRLAAAELWHLQPVASAAQVPVAGALAGDAGVAFAELWQRYVDGDGFIERLASACEQMAAACDLAAMEVEYAKLQYIAALIVLGITLAALAAALWAGGVSSLGMPAAVAAAQFTIRLVLVRLLTAIAVGAAVNVAIDALAQTVQLSAGHRAEWDLATTRRAAEDGAIFGAVGGGVFLAGSRWVPHAMSTPAGVLGASGVTGAAGGLAAPLVHGELPEGRDFVMALSSGLTGGLGPDLARGRVHATDLSRLAALDPDGLSQGGTGLDGLKQGGLGLDGLGQDGLGRDGLGQDARGTAAAAPLSADDPGHNGQPPGVRPRPAPDEGGVLAGGGLEVGGLTARADAAMVPEPAGGPGAPAHPAPALTPALVSVTAPGASAPVPGPAPTSGLVASGQQATGPGGVTPSAIPPPSPAPPIPAPPSPAPPIPAPPSPAPLTPAPSTSAASPSAAPAGAVTASAQPAASASASALSASLAVGGSATLVGVAAVSDSRPVPYPDEPEAPAAAPSGTESRAWVGSDAQAVLAVQRAVFATDAGWAFYAVDDEIRDFARAVQPTEGYVTLDLHGSPDGFQIDDALLTPEQFAHALGELMADGVLTLPEGAGIKLLSCDTAAGGEGSPAARLARTLGVEVIAPDQPVWTTLDGEEVVASPVFQGGVLMPADPPDGRWHLFGATGLELPLTFDPGLHAPTATTGAAPYSSEGDRETGAPTPPDRR